MFKAHYDKSRQYIITWRPDATQQNICQLIDKEFMNRHTLPDIATTSLNSDKVNI
jgi:hypothetical protein